MVASVEEVLQHAEVIVIGNRGEEFTGLAEKLRPDQLVIDFVRIRQIEERHANYAGICW
jgi:GDP-mannose 6-dehydrogenase